MLDLIKAIVFEPDLPGGMTLDSYSLRVYHWSHDVSEISRTISFNFIIPYAKRGPTYVLYIYIYNL